MGNSEEYIALEDKFNAHNYDPIPVVLSKGKGAVVWDPEGNEYIDFLSAYSALNQGHCHPEILKSLIDQASRLTITSRAFYNDQLGRFAKFICEYFQYEMMLPMNTGAEAVETAMKLSRKWGYLKKKIPENQALILACENNFHGRTIGIISMSSDIVAKKDFGPFLPNVGYNVMDSAMEIRYNNLNDLRNALEQYGDRVAAFLVEPIQGEAGIIVPDAGYLLECAKLCKQYNVLFVIDEIQTGLGRAGSLLASSYDNVKPDIVILGKALSGGMYPVSAVLSSREIMLCFKPGEHGSTYGGNPIACAVATTALKVLKNENLCERSLKLGEILRQRLKKHSCSYILDIRGRGLMNAIEMDESKMNGKTAWDFCIALQKFGVLAKPTHGNIIRLTPPLVITDSQLNTAIDKIMECLDTFIKS